MNLTGYAVKECIFGGKAKVPDHEIASAARHVS